MMFSGLDILPAFLGGFVASCLTAILIVLTRRWHGRVSFDDSRGPQKNHDTPTPRIGGVALIVGFGVAAGMARPPARELLLLVGAGGLLAFLAGFAEDVTRRIPVRLRLVVTVFAGAIFCLATGYSVTRLEIPFVDEFMQFSLVSILFTAFAMGCMCHAVNLTDGLNGLASGTGIIMLSAFAIIAAHVGDQVVFVLALALIGALFGFFVVNFPFGHLFLGDGGAYFTGLMLATMAVLLPMRNPEISAWVSVVVLAYPLIELFFSIIRKTIRPGHHPFEADAFHLHLLLYQCHAEGKARPSRDRRLVNSLTSIPLWLGAMTSIAFVVFLPHTREWAISMLALQIAIYLFAYRRTLSLWRAYQHRFASVAPSSPGA